MIVVDRLDEIKKRHHERKRHLHTKGPSVHRPLTKDTLGFPDKTSPELGGGKSNAFIIKCMVAAVLVLAVGVIQKETKFPLPFVKSELKASLNNEFNFAGVSDWYQNKFGSPLAILPLGKKTQPVEQATAPTLKTDAPQSYAVPVSGQVTEAFSQSKTGVTVQTNSASSVESIDSGYILSINNDKDTGKTVVIQHANGDQSIYGKLQTVDVKVYDFVKKGQTIGTVSTDNGKGVFYFAFKKGNQYVDPIQVISFD